MANFTTIQSTTHACTQNVEFSVVKNATFNSGSPQVTLGYARAWIDATALVAGDVIEIRVYRSVGGGTLTADDIATLKTGQIWTRDLGLLVGNWDVTVKITSSTTRTIGFEVSQDTGDYNAATAGAGAVTSIQSGLALAATALSTAQWTNSRAALQDNLDAAVSSRAPAGSALSTAQWTNALAAAMAAADLTRIDAAISTRSPASSAVSSADLTPTRAAKLDNLDAATSTRAPSSSALSTTQWTNGRAAALDLVDVAGSTINANVSAVGSAVANVLARLPAALDGSGNIKAAVQSMATGALDSIFAYVVEAGAPAGSQTFLQGVRAMWSVLLRKASGLAITTPGTERFRNGADTKDVVVATLATDGTRAVTVDGT